MPSTTRNRRVVVSGRGGPETIEIADEEIGAPLAQREALRRERAPGAVPAEVFQAEMVFLVNAVSAWRVKPSRAAHRRRAGAARPR
jgi:hypothetical protein